MSMRYVFLLLVLASPPLFAEPPAVLVLGDSLSAAYGMEPRQGWVELLRQRLDEEGYPHEVVNASISGETTSGGLSRLREALAQHRPAIVIIELGGNDGLRGLPLATIRDNLAALVQMAQDHGGGVLLVGMRLPPNYGPGYTEGFHRIYHELSRRYQVPLVPFMLEGIAGDGRLMQADGIHAAAAAQPRILDNIWPYLQPLLSVATHHTQGKGDGQTNTPGLR